MTIHQTEFGTVETLEFGAADAGSMMLLLHATATGPGSLVRLGKTLGDAGHLVVIPALHRYGGSRVMETGGPLERNVRIARWVLNTFRAPATGVFGQSMGGLTAVLTALAEPEAVDRLMLYEPMVLRALDPDDPADTREREWDRALVRAVADAVGTDGYETATAAFIEAWNEVSWSAIPEKTRETILGDGPGLAAEMLAVNEGMSSPAELEGLTTPTLLLGGEASPALASRILARLEASLPDCRREVFPGLGHMGPVMAPSRVAESLINFLK